MLFPRPAREGPSVVLLLLFRSINRIFLFIHINPHHLLVTSYEVPSKLGGTGKMQSEMPTAVTHQRKCSSTCMQGHMGTDV